MQDPKLEKIRDNVGDLISRLTEDLGDVDYLEVLEVIADDIQNQIESKREEMDEE